VASRSILNVVTTRLMTYDSSVHYITHSFYAVTYSKGGCSFWQGGEPITGIWGRNPSGVQGQNSLWGSQGASRLLKLIACCTLLYKGISVVHVCKKLCICVFLSLSLSVFVCVCLCVFVSLCVIVTAACRCMSTLFSVNGGRLADAWIRHWPMAIHCSIVVYWPRWSLQRSPLTQR